MSGVIRVWDVRVPSNIPPRSHERRARPHVPQPRASRKLTSATGSEINARNRDRRIETGRATDADVMAALRLEYARLDVMAALGLVS